MVEKLSFSELSKKLVQKNIEQWCVEENKKQKKER